MPRAQAVPVPKKSLLRRLFGAFAKLAFILIVIFLSLLLLATFAFKDGFGSSGIANASDRLLEPISIVADVQGRELTGVLKNNSGERITDLLIGFSTYNSADQKLGEVTDRLATLGPGETWAFRCYLFDQNAKTFRYLGFTSSARRYPVNFTWRDPVAESAAESAAREARQRQMADEADAAVKRLREQREQRKRAEQERREAAVKKFREEQSKSPAP